MRWSKAAKSSVSRRTGPPSGWRATSRGGGVSKVQDSAAASVPPVALGVPAGIVARKRVAMGKRPSGSKTSVRAPIQRHSPAGWGSSRSGTSARASAACESSASIGCEKVTERCGASGTMPSGIRRSTVSGPAAARSGRAASPVGGGNGARSVRPVRGGGSDGSRNAKGSTRGSDTSGARRSSTRSASTCDRRVAGGRATSTGASAGPPPSLSRKPTGSSPATCPGADCAAGRAAVFRTSESRACGARGARLAAPAPAATASRTTPVAVSTRDITRPPSSTKIPPWPGFHSAPAISCFPSFGQEG